MCTFGCKSKGPSGVLGPQVRRHVAQTDNQDEHQRSEAPSRSSSMHVAEASPRVSQSLLRAFPGCRIIFCLRAFFVRKHAERCLHKGFLSFAPPPPPELSRARRQVLKNFVFVCRFCGKINKKAPTQSFFNHLGARENFVCQILCVHSSAGTLCAGVRL